MHVWQWGDSLRLFTAGLYGLAGVGLLLVGLGYTLWWTRRDTRRRWTSAVRPVRRVRAGVAPFAGFLLVTQMLVGAFLWYNLGLIEPRFRGQGSFAEEWRGGISVTEELATASTIAEALPESARSGQHAIWRAFGPFLLYHTFGFTGNPWFDTVLLSTLQIMILVMVGTGWAMVLGGRRPKVSA